MSDRSPFEPTQPSDLEPTGAIVRSEPTQAIHPALVDPSLHRFEPTQPIDLFEAQVDLPPAEPMRTIEVDLPDRRAPVDDLEPRPASDVAEIRAPSGDGLAMSAAVVTGILLGTGVWYLFGRPTPPADPSRASASKSTSAPSAPTAPTERTAARPVPPLGASDAYVRELASQLGALPQVAPWLAGDELARRFVAAVLNVAEGTSPATHLRELALTKPFEARASRGRWFVTEASFRRYDALSSMLDSIDPQAAAVAYRGLHPLLDLAYAEIGNPASSFDAAFAEALGALLRVPISDGPLEVVPQGIGYAFADHRLEELTVAEKHLLRFGPENARRVQSKLAALAAACGIEPR